MRSSIRDHSLAYYFTLTFLLSWAVWVPMALDHFSLLPIRLDPTFVLVGRLIGTLGPAAAAILVSALAGGKEAVRSLLGLLRRWRVGWKWYAAAGLVFPLLVFVTAVLYRLLTGSALLPFQPISAGNLIVVAIILTISVLGEEIGWRGFALPGLIQRYSALRASLILGTIHTFWHLPFWTVLGELERFGAGYWLISWIYICGLTIYLTWLMNNTGSSLVIAFVTHWTLNFVTVGFLPITTLVPAYLIFGGLTWLVAFALIRRYGPTLQYRPTAQPGPVKPQVEAV
jgi:uncharacterized protein